MSSVAELLEKREYVAQLRRREFLRRNNGLAFYTPHAKQDQFHRAGNFKLRYARTGNRFGKSTMGAAEDLAWCLGERTWYPEGDPGRTVGLPTHPVKGVILVADWDKAEEIFTSQEEGDRRGKLFAMLPSAALVRVEKNQAGYIAKIVIKSKWGGNSMIYIDTVKSFMSNPMGHESSDWDFVHVDEPIPEDMWIAYSRGLVDRNGAAWFCCTPVVELWINDKFIPSGRTREDFSQPYSDVATSKWIITGSIYDNERLSLDGIQRFVEGLPKDEVATRVHGRPRQLAGVIYKDFDPLIHVYYDAPKGWTDINRPPKNWTIRVAIDPHPRTPHAVLFAATSPWDITYFWAEIFNHCFTSDLCDQIKLILGDLEPLSIICDPIAWIEHPNTGETMADDFHRCGVQVWPAPKDLQRGILRTGEKLRERDSKGHPTLQFSHNLVETIHEFDRYVWDQKKETPYDKAPDHMMECLYRLVIGGLDYVPPETNTTRRVIPMRDIPISDMSIPAFNTKLPQEPPRYG